MGLLKPAKNTTAFLKTGLLGFEGSGKTRTAVELAIGMTKLVGGKKVAFFDTEKGSDFHIERFKAEGLELHVIKSKSFKDLCDVIREAEREGYSYLIIDSITHVWRELVDSYLKKMNRKQLRIQDWGVLKSEWAMYTDLYVGSKIHISMCGRAGYSYDMSEDEDGKMEVRKSGTKMKVETETGFEPDLLLELERIHNPDGIGFINRCYILKDRTDTMNGKSVDYPTFKSFESIMKFLNIGGEHVGTQEVTSSEVIFDNPKESRFEYMKQKEIAIEHLKDVIELAGLAGTARDVVGKRTKVFVDVFGGSGETYMNTLSLDKILEGIEIIKEKHGLAKTKPVANGKVEHDIDESQLQQ